MQTSQLWYNIAAEYHGCGAAQKGYSSIVEQLGCRTALGELPPWLDTSTLFHTGLVLSQLPCSSPPCSTPICFALVHPNVTHGLASARDIQSSVFHALGNCVPPHCQRRADLYREKSPPLAPDWSSPMQMRTPHH